MPPKPKLNVHNFPRPPLLERTPRHLQVKWQGQLIADTKDAYWVLETTHPPNKPIYDISQFFSSYVKESFISCYLLTAFPSILLPTNLHSDSSN